MPKTATMIGVSVAAMIAAGSARAGTLWIANLNQASENPPTGAPYTGTGFLVLNTAETSASVTATHNIPTSLLTGGHIHRGVPGINGPIILPFPNPASPVGPITWAIPTADVANLKAGGLYMNFHTITNPVGAIRGVLVRSLLAPSAADASQLAVADALDVSAGFNADLDQVLMAEAVASGSARTQALSELSGHTLYVQGREAVETLQGFEDDLFLHSEALAPSSGFGLFASAGDTFGKRDAAVGQARSRISRPTLLAGVDYGLSGGLKTGVAIGYADGKDRFRGGVGETQAKTTAVQAFVSATADRFVVTGVAGYGWTKFDTRRSLGSLGRVATSSHDGKVWSLGAKVAAPFSLQNNLTLSPYARLDAQQATIDAYSEAGAGALGLVVPKRKDKSSAVEVGAAATMPLSGAAGGLTAHVEAGWRHLLDDGSDHFATAFEGSPVAFQTDVLSPGRNAAHLTASVSGNLAPNLSMSASYRGLISGHADSHALEIGLTLRM